MKFDNAQVELFENNADPADVEQIRELGELQLSLIGGGIGDVVVH
jgi:hypothetical protein